MAKSGNFIMFRHSCVDIAKRDLKHVLLVLFSLVFSSCQFFYSNESTDLVQARDMSLITGVPCPPPCWQTLIPETSTVEDVLDVLETNEYVRHETVTREPLSGYDDWETIQWQSSGEPVVEGLNRIRVNEKDIVVTITILLGYEITFGELIDHFGEPDVFEIIPYGGRNYFIDLIWLDEGLSIESERVREQQGKPLLTSETQAEIVVYFSPVSRPIDFVAAYKNISPEAAEELFSDSFYDWEGFESTTLEQSSE